MLSATNNSTAKEITLLDQSKFGYTVQPADIKNMLGNVVATLTEYRISQNGEEVFSLFKTKEGNWYEMPDSIPAKYTAVINAIKSTIDKTSA